MRVAVVGTSGSGKSTFAKALAAARGCPHIELDALHWEPGWIEAPDEVFYERLAAATAGPAWVSDGNYGFARDRLWPLATDVVWLDFPRWRVMWRVTVRTFVRYVRGDVVCNGNRESLRMSLCTKDSILLWAWTSHATRQAEFEALFKDDAYPEVRKHRVRTPREARTLLLALAA